MNHSTVKIASNLSQNYKPINSDLVLDVFKAKGWELSQHIGSGLGRHLYTLKNKEYFHTNGDALTITMQNSFDGSTRFALFGGYARLVCKNGLVIGDFEGIKMKHMGDDIYEKLDNSYDKIVAHLDVMKNNVEKLKNTPMSDETIRKVAKQVLINLFEKDTKTYKSEVVSIDDRMINKMITPKRSGDMGQDAFTRLNVLQESIVRYGNIYAKVSTLDKRIDKKVLEWKSVKASENKTSSLSTNLMISEEFLKAVA